VLRIRLRRYCGISSKNYSAIAPVFLYAFDLIELNGDDLRQSKQDHHLLGRRPMGLSFRLRMAKCIAQCLNLEREFHHTASKLCVLGFEPMGMAECIAQCLNVEHEIHHTTSKLCILRFDPIK
jgi:hypothetical protein